MGQNCSFPDTVAPHSGQTCLATFLLSGHESAPEHSTASPPVLCHVVPYSQIIPAEPWTPGSIAMSIVLLGVLIVLFVWLLTRRGGGDDD